MKRFFSFIVIMVLLLGITASLAAAGKQEKEEVIGIAKIVSHPALDAIEQGVMEQLKDMGYEFRYDLQNANGEISTAASIAQKFKNDRVRLAIGIATPTAQALVNTIDDIPVVFSAVTDPVGAGLVDTLKHGKGNVTGISDMTPVKEQIKLLSDIKTIEKLGHIYCSGEANAVKLAEIASDVCKELGIEFVETTVTNSAEVKQAAQSIMGKVDGLYISTDNTVVSALSSVTSVAMKHKVPIMSADPSSAEEFDILVAWGFNYYKMGKATGRMVAEILEGKDPADMPVRFMTKPEDRDLLINLDIADKLGLTIPEDILDTATTVINKGELIQQ